MANDDNGSQIVNTWTDSSCQTGESYYRTADGRTWKTSSGQSLGTGETRGYMRGNKIRQG